MGHNLPARLTSFVGREREIGEIGTLLKAQRLITLVGAPGVGKTRLALQIAAGLLDRIPDGVWLVELAPLGDPVLVPQAVADVLGVREQQGRPLTATLTEWLRSRRLLLVLDNCEHLIGAAAELVEALVRGCPDLHVLATSREPLSIEGETIYRVPSLSVAVAESEAVRLFAERARSASPAFALTDRTAPLVGQICARLDGIPLAIELAAARVRALSVEQIAVRLDDRFRLLTGGSRTALPRQQTLRGTVDWSYDLLSEPEQIMLRRLAVFAGGLTLDAADAVAWDEGRGASEVSLPSSINTLMSLIDKSLVQVDEGAEVAGGERRYRLLETFRQYGWEKLIEHGELEAIRDRHRSYFLAFAEEIGSTLNERSDGVSLARLEPEHDNLRTALTWCLEEPGVRHAGPSTDDEDYASTGAALSVRLAAPIWRYWWLRGHIGEGRRWLARALAVRTMDTSPAGLAARVLALLGIAQLSALQGDFRSAVAHVTEKLTFCREIGDDRGVIRAMHRLGYYLAHLGEAERGMGLCMESVALARRDGNPHALAAALHSAGMVARMSGRSEQSIVLSDEAIDVFREIGNLTIVAYAMSSKSHAFADLGDATRAQALAEDGLRIFQEVGDQRGIAMSFKDLARFALFVALFAGDADRATEALRHAVVLFQSMGDLFLISICLDILAGVAVARGDRTPGSEVVSPPQPDRADDVSGYLLDAVRLYAWADHTREQAGLDPPPEMRGDPERNVALLRERLGETAFALAWSAGRSMSFEQAVEYALALTASAEPGAPDAGPDSAPNGDPEVARLTPREREVAGLIVQGRTNREIAEALVLSERTVDSHVRSVMGKLEVNSRAQIAAWAVQHGLGDPR